MISDDEHWVVCWCSGHGQRGMWETVHVSVTPINCPSHTHCSSVTARRSPGSDGACVVAVLRRRWLDVLCVVDRHAASRALSRCNVQCRSATTTSVATSWLRSSSSARVMTTASLENYEAAARQLIEQGRHAYVAAAVTHVSGTTATL